MALTEIFPVRRLEEDGGDVGQVSRNCKQEQGEGKSFALGLPVLEDLGHSGGH